MNGTPAIFEKDATTIPSFHANIKLIIVKPKYGSIYASAFLRWECLNKFNSRFVELARDALNIIRCKCYKKFPAAAGPATDARLQPHAIHSNDFLVTLKYSH